MFDSIDEVTKDSLKKQRNALNKAFHPDNDEQNEAYSQKINAAYELLSGMVKNNEMIRWRGKKYELQRKIKRFT